jgi:hypothetical protein
MIGRDSLWLKKARLADVAPSARIIANPDIGILLPRAGSSSVQVLPELAWSHPDLLERLQQHTALK